MKFLIILILFISCTSFDSQMKGDEKVKFDLNMTVNGLRMVGFGVLDKLTRYEIKIESEGNMDIVAISNCHKEIIHEGTPKRRGLFRGIFSKKIKNTFLSMNQLKLS